MATRSTIKVEGFNTAKIYKHWDGYPDAMIDWLLSFNADFVLNRGDDPSYKFAQLLRSSVFDAEKFKLDNSRHTGWGVVEIDADCGEDYEYTLLKNGKVTYSGSE
jgi:hypothetical protein